MQLHLETDELNLLANILLERVGTLVARSVAGYDYRGNWQVPRAGFSPARLSASIAAL